MRICIIHHPVLAAAFKSLGHEVFDLRPEPGPQHLPGILEKEGFEPDIVLHVEHLGPRTVLLGLGELSCSKLFWSVDVHLNSWWHRYYARQFDGVFCTQKPWVARLERMGLANVKCLPWHGVKRPFQPWSGRGMGLGFVGRVTEHRPVRKRMVEYLVKNFGMVHLDGLNSSEMFDAYDRTRLVPNESIFSEVNFRLFEAASCGCLVLNQEVDGGVGHVFEPGREVVEFGDILGLDGLVRFFSADPARAENMARAAWERVNREHLPEHRAATILDYAEACRGAAPSGPLADAYAWHAVMRLMDGGMYMGSPAPALEAMGDFWDESSAFFAARLRGLFEMGHDEELVGLLQALIAQPLFVSSFEVNFTASCVALRMGQWDLARTFWLRHVKAEGRESLGMAAGPVEQYLLWAGECERFWTTIRPGYTFDKERTVPDSALECLLMANELEPGHEAAIRRLNVLCAREPGTNDFRMSVLSWLSLRDEGDWRMGLDLGLVNLRSMRMREGLEELVGARASAKAQGAQERFDKILAAKDASGLLLDLVRDSA